MERYIDKTKISEQIDKTRQNCLKVACNPNNEECSDYYLGKEQAYQEMQDFLDTLDVKEVDLEKEINEWQGCEAFPEGCNITPLPKAMDIVEKTAKHFFELGLKVGTNDVWHSYDETIDTNRTIVILSPNGKSSIALWDGKSLLTATVDGGHNVLCNGDRWAYVDELTME